MDPRFERKRRSQITSAVVDVITRYSDSVLDRLTTSCFFDFQKMRKLSRKMQ